MNMNLWTAGGLERDARKHEVPRTSSDPGLKVHEALFLGQSSWVAGRKLKRELKQPTYLLVLLQRLA